MSTPSPMANSSTPTPVTSVVPDETVAGRRGRALLVWVLLTSVAGWAIGKRDWPRRSPHSTQ
jgi:hypothetical protein